MPDLGPETGRNEQVKGKENKDITVVAGLPDGELVVIHTASPPQIYQTLEGHKKLKA